MKKLTAKDILPEGVTLEDVRKSWPSKEEMQPFIEETIRRQEEALKLRDIDPEKLKIRMTI